MTAGGLMFAAEGLAAPQLADCRADEQRWSDVFAPRRQFTNARVR
jgi:hypothetical protein